MKWVRRVARRWRDIVECGGFGLLVLAAWMVHEIAGVLAGAAVLLLIANRGGE